MPTMNHWQNNHIVAKGRHHPCSGKTADMWGLESSIEAAIHAVRKSFEEENSECLLLVDADNAFNKLIRKVNLENIKRLCVSHVDIPTQQLQQTHHVLSGKWEPHLSEEGGIAVRKLSLT